MYLRYILKHIHFPCIHYDKRKFCNLNTTSFLQTTHISNDNLYDQYINVRSARNLEWLKTIISKRNLCQKSFRSCLLSFDDRKF